MSCSSIVLSLFSINVNLSSISLSILPSSSSRGPMYCPGLSGEGRGSMGRGRSGSGRLGRSNGSRLSCLPLRFSGFSSTKNIFFRVGIVGVRGLKTTFQSRKDNIFQSEKSFRTSPDRKSKHAI